MAYTCQYCATLSISRLVELAKEDFSSWDFSHEKFFEHHKSFQDLDASAQNGCGLCRLIIDSFKGIPRKLNSHWPHTWAWEGPECPQASSIYGKLRESSKETDIKLCINTGTSYGDDPLEKVTVLDHLIVKVGSVEYFDRDEIESPIPVHQGESLRLALSTTAGNLQVEKDLGSTTNFSIAKAWLHECQTSHSTCQLKDLPQLPTRVIDVGQDDLDVPRIVTSHGIKASYVALSLCWGGNIPVLLTTETIADFQKALPLSDLSQNFRDAIQITQKLGFRFLWIDSLCILQNSKSDWQLESRRMGHIYRDSTLSIYAAASDRSTAGILCQKTRQYGRLPKPAYIALRPRFHNLDKQRQLVKVSWLPPEEEDLKSIYSHSPLYSRGWCLQESILAPRQLIYGERQLYWRCQARSQSADGAPEGLRYPDINYTHFTSLILSDILAAPSPFDRAQSPAADFVESVLQDYYHLVQAYSTRDLTYSSDKLPAFSGLARLLQPILPHGTPYLAGLWSTDIYRGLLWIPVHKRGRPYVAKTPFRAPSWSWAATDDAVEFDRLLKSIDQPSHLDMKLLESQIVLQNPEDGFGELMSAVMRVQVHVMNLVRYPEVVRIKDGDSIGRALFDHQDEWADENIWTRAPSLFLASAEGRDDFILTVVTKTGEDTELKVDTMFFPPGAPDDMLLMLVLAERDENDAASRYRADCLILQRTEEDMASNAYKRVGTAGLSKRDMDWLMDWDLVVLELV
ncbi:hypothetical protein G7054_g1936 [Neopestalotiopsis clavispora]|nr:hypothetical protein G7054_g1936 [Neopestalotiopsis clavispora]